MPKPFYADGLRFECARCSACCRFDPGYVFLSRKDAENLSESLHLDYSSFIEAYCRWIPIGNGEERLSLKEKSNFDCFFWSEGACGVYESRPLQCRTFPFWDSVVASAEAWRATAADCPGMDRGPLLDADGIRRLIALRAADPVVTRSTS